MTALLLSVSSLPARAEGEYREVRLADGRTYRGEVVDTSDAGLRIRIPAGLVDLPFEEIVDMQSVDPVAGAAGTQPRVLVIPASTDTAAAPLTGLVDALLSQQLRHWTGLVALVPEGLSSAAVARLAACAHDAACLSGEAADLQAWQVVDPILSGDAAGQVKLRLQHVIVAKGAAGGHETLEFARSDPAALAGLLPTALPRLLGITPTAPLASTSVPPPAAPAPEGPPAAAPESALAQPTEAASASAPSPAGPEVGPAAPGGSPIPSTPADASPSTSPAGPTAPPEALVPSSPDATAGTPAGVDGTAETVTPSGPSTPLPAEPAAPDTPSAGGQADVRVHTQPRRRPRLLPVAVALGFLPLPGIANAYLGDKPGFVANLAINVGQGVVVVAAVGYAAETPRAFWRGAILLPYLIGVAVNEVTLLVGYRRTGAAGSRAAWSVLPRLDTRGGLDGVQLGVSAPD